VLPRAHLVDDEGAVGLADVEGGDTVDVRGLRQQALLGRDEGDEKAVAGLRGVVKISHTTVNGLFLTNLDGFAPANQWEHLASAVAPKTDSEVAR